MKKYENFIYALAIGSLLTTSSQATAQTNEQQYTAAELTTLATDWLSAELALTEGSSQDIQVTPLDTRIGTKICSEPLSFTLPAQYNPRQTTLQISCATPASWQLFVPVRITEWLDLVVIKQNIAPGTPLTADMLEIQRRERRLVRGQIITDPAKVIGSRNKRSLSSGQVLNLQELCLVCRGDIVTIEINNNGLAVSATGVAQQDGTLGDTIAVKNQQSGRTIQTEVVAVNQVQVKF